MAGSDIGGRLGQAAAAAPPARFRHSRAGAGVCPPARARITAGTEISAAHHRSVSEGLVTAAVTGAHGGGTKAADETVITDERPARVRIARPGSPLRDVAAGRRRGAA